MPCGSMRIGLTGKEESSAAHMAWRWSEHCPPSRAFPCLADLTSCPSLSLTVLQPLAFRSWPLQPGPSPGLVLSLFAVPQMIFPRIITRPASSASQLAWPSVTTFSKSGLCHPPRSHFLSSPLQFSSQPLSPRETVLCVYA